MTALATAIDSTQTLLTFSDVPPFKLGSLLLIDDELIGVYGPTMSGSWIVARGRQQTAAVAHDQDAAVRAVVPVFGALPIDQNTGPGDPPSLADVLAASPADVVLTADEAAPGAEFVSLLYLDTTSGTGGCYAWDGAGYTKISNI